MSDKTAISWTDATWNPLYGCSRVSKGCERCYAEQVVASLPRKFKDKNQAAYEFFSGLTRETPNGPRWTGVVKLHPEHLLQPLKWKKPRKIFVNSLSDLFHEGVSFETIASIFGVMALAPQHTFQVLTKRPEHMRDFLGCFERVRLKGEESLVCAQTLMRRHDGANKYDMGDICLPDWPLPNVWLGVSVENQEAADKRIPLLQQCPAAVRFLSCEPLLGPVNLTKKLYIECADCETAPCTCGEIPFSVAYSELTLEGISWVIVGGESGPNFRPMKQDWALDIREQCVNSNVAFFYKQDSNRKAGQRPYLIEDDGRAYRWHQFPGEPTEPERVEVEP